MADDYQNDFENFLSHTDEKRVLFEKIKEYLVRFKIKSLMDIGAGNGLLAIPLAKEGREYLAVEPKPNFAQKLRDAGLKVVEREFPADIGGTFDMVLSSHSISYRKESYKPFIKKAVDLLNPNSVFLLITHRGQDDDWTNLMGKIWKENSDYNRIGFNEIIELLYSLGEVKMEKVTTWVKTDDLNSMIQALAFVASDSKPEKKSEFLRNLPKLEKVLDSQYKDADGYSFPFQHFFITTKPVMR